MRPWPGQSGQPDGHRTHRVDIIFGFFGRCGCCEHMLLNVPAGPPHRGNGDDGRVADCGWKPTVRESGHSVATNVALLPTLGSCLSGALHPCPERSHNGTKHRGLSCFTQPHDNRQHNVHDNRPTGHTTTTSSTHYSPPRPAIHELVCVPPMPLGAQWHTVDCCGSDFSRFTGAPPDSTKRGGIQTAITTTTWTKCDGLGY